MSCAAAQKQFVAFLNAENVPSPWIVDANDATFSRGYGSTVKFGIDPINGSIG